MALDRMGRAYMIERGVGYLAGAGHISQD
jgi:hypothetical protein